MGWDLADSWNDLIHVNYSYSEELENGRIAFWRLEDWEIYGPGAGGYTSSGPFGSVESDLYDWVASGTLLGVDVLLWNTGNYSTAATRPNFSKYQQSSQIRRNDMNALLLASNSVKQGSFYRSGAATPFLGNSNPTLGNGILYENEIVVTANKIHVNQAQSISYRVFDPMYNHYLDFSETLTFLELARHDADKFQITADYALVEPPTAQLISAFEVIKTRINQIVGGLDAALDTNAFGYFSINFTDVNGIAALDGISLTEIKTWIERMDFQFFPVGTDFGNQGSGATVYTNNGHFRLSDIVLQVDMGAFINYAGSPLGSYYYIVHEAVHATKFGQRLFRSIGNSPSLESKVNQITLRILQLILGVDIGNYPAGHGYDSNIVVNLVGRPI